MTSSTSWESTLAKIDPEERERRREARRQLEAILERHDAQRKESIQRQELRRQRLRRLTFGLLGR